MSDAASGTIVYGRSIAGEVTSITNQTYNKLPYNPPNVVNGPDGPISYTLGNGSNVLQQYDSLGRLFGRFVCNGPATLSCSGGTQIYGTNAGWKGLRVIGGAGAALNQKVSFGYDEFNRLTSRTVTAGTAQNYTYTYDLYGNRVTQTPLNGGYSFTPTINAANNHITTSGYAYDAACRRQARPRSTFTTLPGGAFRPGRLRPTTLPTRAESTGMDSCWAIARLTARRTSSTRTHWERSACAPLYSGTVGSTYVSLPWGDGYTATVNANAADQDNNHFALFGRDPESNTEHAQFRNYASAQGRWLAPDPYLGSYDLNNPQSFTRYAYALNNPTSLLDPSGLFSQPPQPAQPTLPCAACTGAGGGGATGGGAGGGTSASSPPPATSNGITNLLCAAKYGQAHSIGALFGGGTIENFLEGNSVSGLVNLDLSVTGQQPFTSPPNLTGLGLGLPVNDVLRLSGGQINPLYGSASGTIRSTAIQGIFNAATDSGAISSIAAEGGELAVQGGLTAGEFASGVGIAKFGLDLGTFLVGYYSCATK